MDSDKEVGLVRTVEEERDEFVDMGVLASGEGDLEVSSVAELGMSEHDALTAALLFLSENIRGAFRQVETFMSRRQMVEGLSEDKAALVAHQTSTQRQDDKASIALYVQLELAALVDQLEDAVAIFNQSSKDVRRKVAYEAKEAVHSVTGLCDGLRRGILAMELTGKIEVDDEREDAVKTMETAFRLMNGTVRRLRILRATWARRTLKRKAPKMVALLQARAAQRVRELEKARLDVLEGRITPEEGAAVQFRRQLEAQSEEVVQA